MISPDGVRSTSLMAKALMKLSQNSNNIRLESKLKALKSSVLDVTMANENF
jgi:hypothetical protein